jgi:hypothetical protein
MDGLVVKYGFLTGWRANSVLMNVIGSDAMATYAPRKSGIIWAGSMGYTMLHLAIGYGQCPVRESALRDI